MPAILPARLRQQAILLAGQFTDPPAFVRSLHHLLGFYAERAQRQGQTGPPPPLLPAYRVRPPVLRQLILELSPQAQDAPEAALALCDALWVVGYDEFAQLAISLLGQVPLKPVEAVLLRVERWTRQRNDLRIVDLLVVEGLRRVRSEQPERVLDLVEGWLGEADLLRKQLGLRALRSLVADLQFENLPILFRLVAPHARQIPAGLRPDVLEVIEALARRSPKETAYFLRQHLGLSNSPDIPWLLRQGLNAFPASMQENLRQALRQI